MRPVLIIAGLLFFGCGDNIKAATSDAGPGEDSGPLAACLDRPNADLPPDKGVLPCELIPPGLSLAKPKR